MDRIVYKGVIADHRRAPHSMLNRLIALLESMFKALLGQIERPHEQLEQTYQELQETLIRLRQDLAAAIAKEAELRRNESPEVALQELIVSKLKERVEELERGVQTAYTKKQILIARNKAVGSELLEQKGLMILFFGILAVWILLSAGLLVAHLLH